MGDDPKPMPSFPSRSWSCNTLQEGVAVCARIAGVSLEPDQLQDAMKAGVRPQGQPHSGTNATKNESSTPILYKDIYAFTCTMHACR